MTTQCARRMDRGGHASWRKFRTPNLKCHNIPISPVYCQLPTIAQTSTVGFRSWTLGLCHPGACIRHWLFSCRRRVRAVILADGRVIRSSVGEHCDIVFIMFLFWFTELFLYIIDCFIRKCHTKRILIHSAFVDLFCLSNWFLYLLVGLQIGCLVGCLVIFHFFLFILVLVDCSLGRTTIISRLDFTESPALITMADSPSVSGHRKFEMLLIGALDRGQCTYTYDISQFLRKVFGFHSWIDKLSIFAVVLAWQLVEKQIP